MGLDEYYRSICSLLCFSSDIINLAYEQNISNIAIIGLRLWANGTLIPQQRQGFFVVHHSVEHSNNLTNKK